MVLPSQQSGLRELALFAGAGGGILGGMLLGWRIVCAVEIEDYPRRVLLQRQADGILPRFPIWDDICTFDGKPWRGKVDVISGGFPCQDISCAGKGEGITGAKSGLWGEMARIIGEVRPRFAFVENSPMLTIRGLDRVLGDLSEMGYDARWGVVGAHHVGAPHRRNRIWIVANTMQDRPQGQRQNGTTTRQAGLCRGTWWNQDPAEVGYSAEQGLQDRGGTQMGHAGEAESQPERSSGENGRRRNEPRARSAQSFVGRVAHGMDSVLDIPGTT